MLYQRQAILPFPHGRFSTSTPDLFAFPLFTVSPIRKLLRFRYLFRHPSGWAWARLLFAAFDTIAFTICFASFRHFQPLHYNRHCYHSRIYFDFYYQFRSRRHSSYRDRCSSSIYSGANNILFTGWPGSAVSVSLLLFYRFRALLLII